MTPDAILFLAHRLPYPPDRGDRIRSWHVLRALAELGPVHVVTPLDSAQDRQHVAMVESVAASVNTAVRTRGRAGALLTSFTSGRPASVEMFSVPSLRDTVNELLAGGTIATVYAFSGQMAAYVPDDWRGRFIMDFVDVDSAKFEEQGRGRRTPTGWLLEREARRLAAFEAATARRADCSIFVSRAEAELFTARSGLPAVAVGNGIDLEYFSIDHCAHRAGQYRGAGSRATASGLIVFTGQMDYGPNVEAVIRFARHDLPRIREAVPDAIFAVVGRAPAKTVTALACDHVIVTGEVPDTRPWLAAASAVVAPLALARGVQNKVLEAMAMGRAVVLSPEAAQGIDAGDGRDFIIAADPVAPVVALLRDRMEAEKIGSAARARMEAAYGWGAQLAPLGRIVAP